MIVTALFKAKPGYENDLKKILHETAQASWQENGVRSYAVHQIKDEVGSFLNVEIYESKQAFETHLATNHVKTIIDALDHLLSEPAQILQMNGLFVGEHSKSSL